MRRPSKMIFNKVRGIYEFVLTEENVVNEIMTRLTYAGATVWRLPERIPRLNKSGRRGRLSTPGIPDVTGWFAKPTLTHPGLVFPLHFFIEVKKPGGKRRPAQIAWIEAAQRDRVLAFFAESWENVITEFRNRGIEVRA